MPLISFILAGAAGLILGTPLVKLAAKRSTYQPIAVASEAERCLIATVMRDPYQYLRLTLLTPGMFAHRQHGEIWAAFDSLLSDAKEGAKSAIESKDEKKLEALIVDMQLANMVSSSTVELVRERVMAHFTTDELEKLAARNDEELLDAGMLVLDAYDDRTRLNGVSRIVETPEGSVNPLVRVHAHAGIGRAVIGSSLLAVMFTVGAFTANVATSSKYGMLLAVASFTVLAAGSLLWAFVDWDTFYLDTPSFWTLGIASWILAVAAAFADGDPKRVLAGLGIALGGALVLEAANLAFKLLRGQDGMGGGDTLILLATAGVPAALTGSWQLGYLCVMGSMVLGVLGWIVLRLSGRITRESPFAFGPYLALGWALSCSVWSFTV
jgi:prepilin signal peptidase PulO-like enzyme (type II secretory pathway)